LKTLNGGGLSVPENQQNDAEYLSQNYPNPVYAMCRIDYENPEHGHVILRLFDQLGNLLVTLVNEKQTDGDHSVTFDAWSLRPGLYYYQITAGKIVQTRKMIVVH
jgi:hypothetical protein